MIVRTAIHRFWFCLVLGSTPGSVHATPDQKEASQVSEASLSPEYQVVVSVADQRLGLFRQHDLVAVYPVSTSKFGLGDDFGSYKTPLGKFRVRDKIGGALAAGAVLKERMPTGEFVRPDTPGRDPIVSRIIWLEGLEAGNQNAFDRGIYIHGTTEETELGRAASWGCVRMSSRDIIELFQAVPVGTSVEITLQPLAASVWEETLAKTSFAGAHPLTIENSLPAVSANFGDITYTALLEHQSAGDNLALGSADLAPIASGPNVATHSNVKVLTNPKNHAPHVPR